VGRERTDPLQGNTTTALITHGSVCPPTETGQLSFSFAIKRLFDIAASLLGLLLVAPVIALAAIAVLLIMGRPVFFRQTRFGHKGKHFVILKLRTMRAALDANGVPLPDAQRLTYLGNILRRTSIDELPQLWNVLIGDMSLVGPRPQPLSHFPDSTAEVVKRHTVLPGLTGWAQIHGRKAVSLPEICKYDAWYVDHWSLWLDLKILVVTPFMLFRQEGINRVDPNLDSRCRTMPERSWRADSPHARTGGR
jgi:lipopolysaccharide/colanic/teichoic acid biosynthesis glycosyltransferase